MNQILVTKKLYVTPELKRKKKIYKISFMISIFLVSVLCSFYIYAEYDKNRNEDISKEILSGVQIETEIDEENETNSESDDDNTWKILVASREKLEKEKPKSEQKKTVKYGTYTASNGNKYTTVGSIKIPKINVEYPILSDTSVSWLKVSPCKFWGANPNEVGNLCIAGHNYRNKRFFSKVPKLVVGDIIEITDLDEKTIKYSVYDKYTVDPDNRECTSQLTNGKKIVTLITCTDDSSQRVIVQAEEV